MTLSRRVPLLLAALYLVLLSAPSTFAQGTTGSLTGTVTSGGAPLPGVSVMIASSSLQGSRTAVTGESGGDRPEPSSLLSLHYGGVLTRNLLVEGQYSRMNNSFSQGGNS